MAKTADSARKAAMAKKPAAKIKVSQKTIDSIKKLGMTEALKLAGKNGNPAGGMASEYQEGIRRMYGAKRLEAAKTKYAPIKAKTADAARGGATKLAPKPAPKNNNKSNLAKAAGAAVAVGALVASRGKAAGLASKLSPAVGNLAKSSVGKAVFGTGEKLTNKAFSASGRITAKAGKPVSQTQYEAMMSAAKAKGIKTPTADAAKAITKNDALKFSAKGKVDRAKTLGTATKPKAKLTKTAAKATGASNQIKTKKK